jgi:sugar transferase (PEP-CTERM/EpsH1 system associated)
MRVMHVVHTLAMGGTEQGVRKLLCGLDSNLFEQIVCTVVPASAFREGTTRIVSLDRSARKTGFLLPDLVRIFRRERPHIVHSRNWGTIEAVPAAHLAGVSAVIHSEHGRDLNTMCAQPWRRRMFRRFCYGCADRVFAVSQELQHFYSAQLGIPASRFEVIHNGVDTKSFHPDANSRMQLRQVLGIPPGTLVVGTVGRLDPVKDHCTLIRGAEFALSLGVSLYLVIVGDGPERLRLEQDLGSRRSLAGRTLLAGNARNVAEWLNAFDVFVLPSVTEGMSNTLLEAMSVGVPPIATRVGGNPEVVEDERCGVLIDPGDFEALGHQLKRMATLPNWREGLGRNSRQRVETCFSLRRMLRAYSDMYSEVLTPRVGREPAFLGS